MCTPSPIEPSTPPSSLRHLARPRPKLFTVATAPARRPTSLWAVGVDKISTVASPLVIFIHSPPRASPSLVPHLTETLAAVAARFRGHRASRASIWSSPSSSSSSTSPTPSGPSRAPLLRPERARLQPSDRRCSSPIPATSRHSRAHCHSLRLRCELPLLLPLSVSSPTFRSRRCHRRPKPTPQRSSSPSSSSMSCSPELATVH